METYKFSQNKKTNGVLNEIYADLLTICDGGAFDSWKEIRRYYCEFPNEPDHNLAQYGNLLIYHCQVRDFYERHGYKSMRRMSNAKIWAIYLRQVGYVARLIATNAI
jgi:hypothetical protein